MNLRALALAVALLCGVPAVAGAQPGTEPSGSLTFEYNGYVHITTSTTTTTTNARLLSAVCVNTVGAMGATITIYDSADASGTIIAIIDATVARCVLFNAALTTGLTVKTATGTPGDYTVLYR